LLIANLGGTSAKPRLGQSLAAHEWIDLLDRGEHADKQQVDPASSLAPMSVRILGTP
jgi:hypothetical protein